MPSADSSGEVNLNEWKIYIKSETDDEDNEEVSLLDSNQKPMLIRPKLRKNVQVPSRQRKCNEQPQEFTLRIT